MTRWIVGLVVLALVGGLVFLLRRPREVMPSARPPAPLPTVAAPAAPAPAPAASAPRLPTAATPALPAPPAPPAPDPEREEHVRGQIDAVLDRYPGVASIKKLECQRTGACEVEIEARDLASFSAPFERLQDPASGLHGDHAIILLHKPEPLGPDGTGPFRFSFHLTPPELVTVLPN